MIRGSASLVIVAACLTTGAAQAVDAPERVSLRWNAPDACPDDSELVHAVEEFLGQPLSASREQQLSISINVVGALGTFSAKLSFMSPQGTQERFLEHAECHKLTEGVALLAALAIDPERVKARQAASESNDTAATKPTEPTPEAAVAEARPAPSTPPAPRVVCPEPEQAPPPPRPTSQGTLSAAGLLGVGTLPGAVPGITAEVGWRLHQFRAALVGRWWSPSSTDVASTTPRSIELSLATVGLRGCVVPAVGVWSWLACAGADFGDMAGSGQGVDDARTQHALFASAEASLALAYTRSPLAPFVGLGASLSLARPRFGVVRNGAPDETFQPSWLGGLAFVGLTYGL
jgi:hypothetical protein